MMNDVQLLYHLKVERERTAHIKMQHDMIRLKPNIHENRKAKLQDLSIIFCLFNNLN